MNQQKPLRPRARSDLSGLLSAGMAGEILPGTACGLHKPPGASGPLQISTAPTSLIDTAATINAILGLGDTFAGRPILELRPDQQRMRGFYFHAWQRKDFVSDYVGPIQEYIIDGSVYDRTAWNWGVTFLSPTEQAKTETNGADATLTP